MIQQASAHRTPATATDASCSALSRWLGPPTAKTYVRGTQRGRTPDETLQVIRPCFPRFGITRVADVTGLDRIGIPVWMSVRPNSRSLSVTQGKGLDHVSACVSAAMESIEAAHGELPARCMRFEGYQALRDQEPVVDVATLPAARHSTFSPHRKVFWAKAYDLLHGQAIWAPYEMVHTDATLPWMPGSGAFIASTNGLASGNSLAEAVLHGLCEVIERDAMALWEHATPAAQDHSRIDLGGMAGSPLIGEVLDRFRAARISAMAWDATSDVGIAVVRAIIFDDETDAQLRPMPAAFGAGCHPDRNVALLRALTEAAQSRLTVIAGSRDDFGRARYRSTQDHDSIEFWRRLARELPSELTAFSELPTWNGATVDDDLAHVLQRLQSVGIERVLAVDLSLDKVPISVARILVPGLEGPTESQAYVPGPRVRSALARQAMP